MNDELRVLFEADRTDHANVPKNDTPEYKAMRERDRPLEFSVDPDTNKVVVRVVDEKTNETVYQMPTEEALELAKTLDKALDKFQHVLGTQTA